jgi:hypothetical protein
MNETSHLPIFIQHAGGAAKGDRICIQDTQQLCTWSHALNVGVDVVRKAIKAFGGSAMQLRVLSARRRPGASSPQRIL